MGVFAYNRQSMQVDTAEPGDVVETIALVKRAASVLIEGGLVVFPTETVYGVGTCVNSDAGMAKLRELKANGREQTFTVHLPYPGAAADYVDLSRPGLRRLIDKVFPGPVTLLVEAEENAIQERLKALGLSDHQRDRLYHGRTVGLRCPDHAMTRRMLEAVGQPVVAASANTPHGVPPRDAERAAAQLDGRVDYVLDGGPTRYAKPSTVVRLGERNGSTTFKVERAGVYDERYLRKLMRYTILLVCSGNTCRSPMAEGLARQILAERRGIAPDELETAGIKVVSAGTFAMPGSPASPEAVEALAGQGVDIADHRSTPLTPGLIHEADVIYTMTESHRRAVIDMAPNADGKTFRLDDKADISDPIGLDATAYQRTAEMIRRRLEQRLKEQQL